MGDHPTQLPVNNWKLYKLPRPVSQYGYVTLLSDYTHAVVPFDEYNHAMCCDVFMDGDDLSATCLTDPYCYLTYALGSGGDFTCFDHSEIEGYLCKESEIENIQKIDMSFLKNRNTVKLGLIALHAVYNSETGGYIGTTGYGIAPPENAITLAEKFVNESLNSQCYNNIKHTMRGWNQDETYWIRQVAKYCMGNNPRTKTLDVRILPLKKRFSWQKYASFLYPDFDRPKFSVLEEIESDYE